MEAIDIFNDVLTTDRRQSQEVHVNKEGKEPDNTLNISRMSFFVNPTYSAGLDSKPYTVSSQYMKKKRRQGKKSDYVQELTHLLALAEIRYLGSVGKLKAAICANKKLYLMQLVNLIKKAYPVISKMQKLLKKIYLHRWVCRAKEMGAETGFSKTFKIWAFFMHWMKINKRNQLRALLTFKERGMIHDFAIQYYGIDSISKKKLSKFVPPHKKEEPNKHRLERLNISPSKQNPFKVSKESRIYFK
jgi:hypothetical protein